MNSTPQLQHFPRSKTQNMSQFHIVTLLVSTQIVGLLIGKNGATLREIISESSANIFFQSIEDLPECCSQRIISVVGSRGAILQAVARIVNRVQLMGGHFSKDGRPDPAEIADHNKQLMKWIIPQYLCGALIGRGGEGIKRINDVSGAWVKVAHTEEFNPGLNERLVYIRGTPEQNAKALQIIIDRVGGRPFQTEQSSLSSRTAVEVPFDALPFVINGSDSIPFNYEPDIRIAGVPVSLRSCFEGGKSDVHVYILGDPSLRSECRALVLARLKDWKTRILGSVKVQDSSSRFRQVALAVTEELSADGEELRVGPTLETYLKATAADDPDSHIDLPPDVCGLNIAISAHCAEWFERSVTMDEGHFLTSLCTRSGCYVQVLNHSSTASNHCATKEVSVIAPTIANLLLSVSMILDHISESKVDIIPDIPCQVDTRKPAPSTRKSPINSLPMHLPPPLPQMAAMSIPRPGSGRLDRKEFTDYQFGYQQLSPRGRIPMSVPLPPAPAPSLAHTGHQSRGAWPTGGAYADPSRPHRKTPHQPAPAPHQMHPAYQVPHQAPHHYSDATAIHASNQYSRYYNPSAYLDSGY